LLSQLNIILLVAGEGFEPPISGSSANFNEKKY